MSALLSAPRWTRLVAPIAAIWYAFGLSQALIGYLADPTVSPMMIWIAYAVACIAGIIGSAALFFRPGKAAPLFAVSLMSAVSYFGWVFAFGTPAAEDYGIGAMVIGVTFVLLIAARRV